MTRWVSLGLVALVLAVHLFALPAAPLTDDDDFYLPAGKSYAGWLMRAVSLERAAFSKEAIDAAFTVNHEHPPVAKYGFGVAGALFGPVLGPIAGPRVATALFSTLAAAMLLFMAQLMLGPRRGLIAGGIAVLCLLGLPRFFLHARVATLDVPVTGMYLAVAALALAAERSWKSAIAVGPVFGLAAATKLNAPFFVVPYLIYAVLVRGGAAKAALGPGRGLRLPVVPAGFFSMAVLGPLTFFLVWPWMWFDTVERVTNYVQFHLNHYGIYFLYFNELYEKDPFAPWHAPVVMAAITVPLAISALAVLGLGFGAPAVGRRLYMGDAARAASPGPAREGEYVLWLGLHAAATLLTVALSGGAKYGGEKLFMPFFPFWCALAGYGALRLLETVKPKWSALTLALAGISALAQHGKYGGAPLSQYNGAIGGLRGATAAGFERQYYDLAFRDLVVWLNENAPPGAGIHFLPNNWEYVRTYKWYREEGSLREDLRVVNGEAAAQIIVLTHERRFRRYGADLARLRPLTVLFERRVDGVPLWTVLSR